MMSLKSQMHLLASSFTTYRIGQILSQCQPYIENLERRKGKGICSFFFLSFFSFLKALLRPLLYYVCEREGSGKKKKNEKKITVEGIHGPKVHLAHSELLSNVAFSIVCI